MLEQKILKTIKKYELIKNGDNIVVGVSGGPDSMALLNALINIRKSSNLKFGITVAHINHMIRIEAEEETRYVQNFCNKKQYWMFYKKRASRRNCEDRKNRNRRSWKKSKIFFFDEVAKKVNANKIATAHNANDNAETVLMNIIRGSGTSGLKGIEPIRENKYIRALIECTRVEIEEYCEEQNLAPKIDKSNMENIYTRNKVRNLLIPYIKENFNPNIITSLNRLSNLASNENEFIQKKSRRKL